MITHVLMGYGYCASFLAKKYIGKPTLALSRTPVEGINHQYCDIGKTIPKLPDSYILYYFIPPNDETSMAEVLKKLNPKPQKIIYIGSSGIYGDNAGAWVDEYSPCHIENNRQRLRQEAEIQLQAFSDIHHIPTALLRVAGIYGPERIPLLAAQQQQPLIHPSQAPLINHIWIDDLVNTLELLGTELSYHGVLNIADGNPTPMGELQQTLADLLHLTPAPYQDFNSIWNQATSMKREFMSQNKKLSNQRLLQILSKTNVKLHTLHQGLSSIVNNT